MKDLVKDNNSFGEPNQDLLWIYKRILLFTENEKTTIIICCELTLTYDIMQRRHACSRPACSYRRWMDTRYILSFNVNEQLWMALQNSCEVNREHAHICSGVLGTWLDQTEWSCNNAKKVRMQQACIPPFVHIETKCEAVEIDLLYFLLVK